MNKNIEAFVQSITECGGDQSYAVELAVALAQSELESRIIHAKTEFSNELSKMSCWELRQIIEEGGNQ